MKTVDQLMREMLKRLAEQNKNEVAEKHLADMKKMLADEVAKPAGVAA